MKQIVINSAETSWLKYIVELGKRGSHPLFEEEQIRRAFQHDIKDFTELGSEKITEINEAIGTIIQTNNIISQKDYIDNLKPDILDIIVLLYFQMLDQQMYFSNTVKH